MLKAYKYRLCPNAEQMRKINLSIGTCRLVYNLALQTKIWAYQAGVRLSYIDLCHQLVELKKEYPWMAEVNSQALQASIKKLDRAFTNFYHGSGYPKFKKKRSGGSFQCPGNTRKVDWLRSTLTLPKLADIPLYYPGLLREDQNRYRIQDCNR